MQVKISSQCKRKTIFYFTIFRASGDTAAASDDSDKIRVMRSSDGILQLLPPLKLDKKFKR